jgi:Na+/phosphate symporter
VYHIKDSGKVCNYVTYLSEIIYIALFPALVYIIVRSKKYNELIKKGTIVIPPHTPNIFLSIAVSFILFFLAILMLFTGNEETYNILEAGALFAFVLVGYSYGRDMEKALKASS